MEHESNIWSSQTTANAYADLGSAWGKRGSKTATIVFANTGGTNGATYQLMGSVDGTTFVNIGSPANVALGATAVITVTDYWPYLKLQVKDQVGGSHTPVSAAAASVSA